MVNNSYAPYDFSKMSSVEFQVEKVAEDETHVRIKYNKSQHEGYENLVAITANLVFEDEMNFMYFRNGSFIMPGYEFEIIDYDPSIHVFVLRRVLS